LVEQKDKLLLGVKQLALFGAVLGLVFGTGAVSYGDAFASGNDKVYVCHDGKDKKIKEKSLKSHLKHGDTLGKCGHDDDDDGDDDKHDDKKFKKHKVLTGDGPPPEKLGKKGDLYFDSWDIDDLDYYVKIEKKVWEFRGTLVEVNGDCESTDIIKFDGSKWMCADDDDPSPTNELQDLEIDEAVENLLITGGEGVAFDDFPFTFDTQNCEDGFAVVEIDEDGMIICEEVGGALEEGSVTSSEILDGTIENDDMGLESVDTANIVEGSITNDLLDSDSVNGDNIEDGTINTEDLAPDAVSLIVDAKQISITLSIEPSEPGTLTGSCSLDNQVITGFTVINPEEDGPIAFSSVSISVGPPQGLSVTVINHGVQTDTWKLLLFCTSISPLGP